MQSTVGVVYHRVQLCIDYNILYLRWEQCFVKRNQENLNIHAELKNELGEWCLEEKAGSQAIWTKRWQACEWQSPRHCERQWNRNILWEKGMMGWKKSVRAMQHRNHMQDELTLEAELSNTGSPCTKSPVTPHTHPKRNSYPATLFWV